MNDIDFFGWEFTWNSMNGLKFTWCCGDGGWGAECPCVFWTATFCGGQDLDWSVGYYFQNNSINTKKTFVCIVYAYATMYRI